MSHLEPFVVAFNPLVGKQPEVLGVWGWGGDHRGVVVIYTDSRAKLRSVFLPFSNLLSPALQFMELF